MKKIISIHLLVMVFWGSLFAIQNGDFNNGLNGWDTQGSVNDAGGYACIDNRSVLSQTFDCIEDVTKHCYIKFDILPPGAPANTKIRLSSPDLIEVFSTAGLAAGTYQVKFPICTKVTVEFLSITHPQFYIDNVIDTCRVDGFWGVTEIQPMVIPDSKTPFDMTWDWTGHKRKINFCIDPVLISCIVISEPDKPQNLFEAALHAFDIWNFTQLGLPADCQWQFLEVVWGDPSCELCVTKDSTELQNTIDSNEASMEALGYFRKTSQDSMGEYTKAFIRLKRFFQPDSGWGTKNSPAGNKLYDPIIVMMHEIGHAMRLDDVPVFQAPTFVTPGSLHGTIMRSNLTSGLYSINPLPQDEYLPHIDDLTGVKKSAETKLWPTTIPTVSQWGIIILGILLLTIGSVSIVRQRRTTLVAVNNRNQNLKVSLFSSEQFGRIVLKSIPFILVIIVVISIFEGRLFTRNITGTIISGLIISYLIHFISMNEKLEQ